MQAPMGQQKNTIHIVAPQMWAPIKSATKIIVVCVAPMQALTGQQKQKHIHIVAPHMWAPTKVRKQIIDVGVTPMQAPKGPQTNASHIVAPHMWVTKTVSNKNH